MLDTQLTPWCGKAGRESRWVNPLRFLTNGRCRAAGRRDAMCLVWALPLLGVTMHHCYVLFRAAAFFQVFFVHRQAESGSSSPRSLAPSPPPKTRSFFEKLPARAAMRRRGPPLPTFLTRRDLLRGWVTTPLFPTTPPRPGLSQQPTPAGFVAAVQAK
jgi:hypothetical protein